MSRSHPKPVTRRRVFYIPGYDPIHPRRYRELYRKEGAAQAAISGYEIALTPAPKSEHFGWQVDARIGDQAVHADVEVLVWSDIVRDSMEASIPGTYLQLVRTAWTYIASGALRRLMRLRKGPVIAALYPVGMLLLQLLIAYVAGALILAFGKALLAPWLGLAGEVIAAVAGVLAFVALLRWFKAKDGKFFAYYLMHDYAYSAASKGANPPALEERMRAFQDSIAAALEDNVDEVLVVGHSSGAHLAVSILADLIRAGRVPADGPALAFLSLGQVVPMVSFLPDAHRLRADLQYLSARDELTWVDVTAPGDGCAFALCDPVSVSGVAPEDKRWPLVFSAAFTQSLSPARWKELRWRFFRLHFQYLCAFDRPRDYDYFQITAGPMTLADRYADRPPSKSRIDVPVSKYTSVAA
ncbi:SoxR reducing system RseC family protein [Tateyamaria omphalii]|uniref:SoxR reducing system RseC family protein n=1 Tax=Tateyamaria omphalii TaxID=299262 RepID=UPI001C9914AE|nr:SoxR reducing system RseC family protein [Tateyamaria omphalii]MBY5932653.1 SoxR reducing system RseC family protein [Tateyamaria omphalii]